MSTYPSTIYERQERALAIWFRLRVDLGDQGALDRALEEAGLATDDAIADGLDRPVRASVAKHLAGDIMTWDTAWIGDLTALIDALRYAIAPLPHYFEVDYYDVQRIPSSPHYDHLLDDVEGVVVVDAVGRCIVGDWSAGTVDANGWPIEDIRLLALGH